MTGEDAVRESLDYLRAHLQLETTEVEGHLLVEVRGCDEEEAVDHIGRFLVGAIAAAIRTDLELQPVLLSPGLDGQAELTRDIDKILGVPGVALTDNQRTHTRDPWIGEALGHLVLVLSDQPPHPAVPAPMVAAHLPHVEAREHGLDLFGFAHPEFTVVIGEAKTSKAGIAAGLRDAEQMLTKIENGDRDHDVRRAVNGLLSSLSDDVRPLAVGAIWKGSRSYLPVLCFETGITPTNEREVLKELTNQGADCRLIVLRHTDHDGFFQAVAGAMRRAVETISPT